MSAKLPRPIRAVHCFQTQLENAGNAGSTVLDLLELQSSNQYSRLPGDEVNASPWAASRKVLDIKLTNQCGYGLDLFQDIKALATTGLQLQALTGVLYAVLTVTDSLSPQDAPLRIACTLHLGGPIPWEIENDANCYELIEHAVELFSVRRKATLSLEHERFDFVFQGEPFYLTAAALTGSKSLLSVVDASGCERGQAVV